MSSSSESSLVFDSGQVFGVLVLEFIVIKYFNKAFCLIFVEKMSCRSLSEFVGLESVARKSWRAVECCEHVNTRCWTSSMVL